MFLAGSGTPAPQGQQPAASKWHCLSSLLGATTTSDFKASVPGRCGLCPQVFLLVCMCSRLQGPHLLVLRVEFRRKQLLKESDFAQKVLEGLLEGKEGLGSGTCVG